jgi:hypothetical protein
MDYLMRTNPTGKGPRLERNSRSHCGFCRKASGILKTGNVIRQHHSKHIVREKKNFQKEAK